MPCAPFLPENGVSCALNKVLYAPFPKRNEQLCNKYHCEACNIASILQRSQSTVMILAVYGEASDAKIDIEEDEEEQPYKKYFLNFLFPGFL